MNPQDRNEQQVTVSPAESTPQLATPAPGQTTQRSGAKKSALILLGIILVILGLQGLYAQTANSSHDIVFTSVNAALFVLGVLVIYKVVRNKGIR